MYRVYDITSYIDKVMVKVISKNAKKEGFYDVNVLYFLYL